MELHLNILRGVEARNKTPFFTALVNYSKQPTGVFHAMPISRGQIDHAQPLDPGYGRVLRAQHFLGGNLGHVRRSGQPAGTARTDQGGAGTGKPRLWLQADLLCHQRHIDLQQDRRAGGVVRPGDIVLVDRDCHKSHHYGMVLAGAEVVYLDSYPLNEYSMYGAVPLREIKHQLLALKAAGKLDRVRMLLLTNCTFDGLVYNVERVMEECLAIKPDLVFLWDEAWFAFARFSPTYRQRTGMRTANNLRKRLRTEDHKPPTRRSKKSWKAHR